MVKKKQTDWGAIFLIIVLIIVIIIFIVSIGKIDFFNKSGLAQDAQSTEDIEKKKKKDLEQIRNEKARLKESLDIKAGKYYKWAKYAMFVVYLGLNCFGWIIQKNSNFNQALDNLLNYNQAVLILYLLFMLIFPKKPVDIRDMPQILKSKIKTYIYSKYPTLEEEIKSLNEQIEKLSKNESKIDKLS